MSADSVVANFATVADDWGFPFQTEWLEAQREPLPDFSGGFPKEPSPLAIDRLPERKQETLNERKETWIK